MERTVMIYYKYLTGKIFVNSLQWDQNKGRTPATNLKSLTFIFLNVIL
jgi:hypothetical protein